MTEVGVYSEVGKLRKVMVHQPDLSLRRLTPSNHAGFLFDEVLWVDRALQEHNAFVRLMRDEGVNVYYLQELLAGTLSSGDEIRQQMSGGRVSRNVCRDICTGCSEDLHDGYGCC